MKEVSASVCSSLSLWRPGPSMEIEEKKNENENEIEEKKKKNERLDALIESENEIEEKKKENERLDRLIEQEEIKKAHLLLQLQLARDLLELKARLD